MGLAQFQAVLARLYADSDFRESISEDLTVLANIDGLTDPEKANLLELITKGERLNQFARSLISKRRGEVVKHLPITVSVLGPEFRQVFATYAASQPQFDGPRKHLQDACAFARFVLKDQKLNDRDAIRFEADCLEMRLRPKLFRIGVYRWSEHFRIGGDRKVRFVIVVWWMGRGRELRMRVIG